MLQWEFSKSANDILFNEEKIRVDRITGHGGLFKTKGVGQRILAAAINSPISVMETAGEGGAWGIALLASYLANNGNDQSLADFLDKHVSPEMPVLKSHRQPKM